MLGKVVFWFFYSCLQNAYSYVRANKETEQFIKDILVNMTTNKKFCEDAAKLADGKDGINDSVANRIIKLPFVQQQITEKINKNKFIKKTDLENGVKQVIIKAWNNKAIVSPAIDKVKNEIKIK